MKNIFATLFLFSLTFHASSQETSEQDSSSIPVYQQCKSFLKTPPLRDLIKSLTPIDDQQISANATPKPVKKNRYADPSLLKDKTEINADQTDPVLQSKDGTGTLGEFRVSVNFNGQFGGFPPDPTGAAGTEYYMQAVNSTYRIYTKDGIAETGVYSLNSLWDQSGSGDPIVMYDRFAERWFISQFYGSPSTPENERGILIAVSETSDPLGSYYAYQYEYDQFPDYPKFSVWSNAYYMSANSSTYDCSAFEREKMLVGDPTAGVLKMNFPELTLGFNSIAPAYAEGSREPEMNEPCYFFAVQEDSYEGISTDHIKVLKAEVDWDAPFTSNVSVSQAINTENFNTIFDGVFSENIAQKGSSQLLDALPGVFMYRVQYRRFSQYNVIMLCHTVNIGGNRAGMRWYELREPNNGIWAIHQQGTYAPDTENSRWLGNLAMDAQGNIAMAYSFTGPDNFPGIRFTGRFKDDPLGEMTVPEQIAVLGESAQTTGGRYGDYSQMTIDPTDDMTFWFTGEYIGTFGSRRTRIFSFSSWHLASTTDIKELNPYFNAYQPNVGELMLKWNDIIDSEITFTLTDIRGRFILQEKMINSEQEKSLNIPENTNGIYFITLQGKNTSLRQKIYIGR